MLDACIGGGVVCDSVTRNVVIADQSTYWSSQLAASFQLVGYDTAVVADVEEVAESLTTKTPSLVVSEIELQHGTGLDLLQFARGRSNVPFVFVTATSSISVVRAAYGLGCNAFLTKPTTAVEVLEMAGVASPAERIEQSITLHIAAREYIMGVFRDTGTIAEAARRLSLHKRSLRRMLAACSARPRDRRSPVAAELENPHPKAGS